MDPHNHLAMVYQFNTAGPALGREFQEFIRRGRQRAVGESVELGPAVRRSIVPGHTPGTAERWI